MLSEARHKQLMSGMNSTAKKVYAVVPIAEAWTVKQIGIQLHRDGTAQVQDVILACLDNLKRAGLITEKQGCFQRVGIKRKKAHSLADLADVVRTGIDELTEVVQEALHPPAAPAPAPTPKPATKAPMTATTKHPEDVVETLSGLSQSMNALALAQQQELTEMISRHRAEMETLAHELADAAIEVQAALEATSEEVQAARDLKALMKRIGG